MTQISEPSTEIASDATLLRQFVTRHDDLAFRALVLRHGPMVLGICRRILRQPTDADDAFQTTFLLLAVKANQIKQPQLLGNWLFGVATRTSIGVRRSNARRVVQEKRLMGFLRPRGRDETKDADLRMMLDEQINRLPEKLRRVIVCCHLEGMTKREAARRLRVNDSTIMDRLKQARALLKQRLIGKGVQMSDASLGTILVAVAVPTVLVTGTVKAATLSATGKLATAGVASGKTAGVSKGASNVLLGVKMKLAASLLIASGLAVTGAVTVAQQRASSPAVPAVAPAATQPAAPVPDPMQKFNRLRQVLLALVTRVQKSNLPRDLKALSLNDSDIEYLGQGGVNPKMITESGNVAILVERPAPGFDGPIYIGFLDAHISMEPQLVAQEVVDRSRKAIQAAAEGKHVPPEVLPPTTRRASPFALSTEIRQALSRNAEALSPLTIAWSASGFSALPQDQAIARYYIGPGYFQTSKRRIIWQTGKWYNWSQYTNNSPYESAFDSSNWSYLVSGKKPHVSTTPLAQMKMKGPLFVAPYFEHNGVHLPAKVDELRSGVATSTILSQLDSGGALTTVDSAQLDGHPYVRLTVVADNPDRIRVLRTLPADRTYVYYLDPAMNYALRRTEQRYDRQMLITTDNEAFEELPGRGIWLPRKSTNHYYTAENIVGKYFPEPILGETFEITELSGLAVSDEQFVLKLPAGAEAAKTPIAANPSPAADRAHSGVLAEAPSVESPVLTFNWLLIGGIGTCGIAVLLAFVGIHRYRRATR